MRWPTREDTRSAIQRNPKTAFALVVTVTSLVVAFASPELPEAAVKIATEYAKLAFILGVGAAGKLTADLVSLSKNCFRRRDDSNALLGSNAQVVYTISRSPKLGS